MEKPKVFANTINKSIKNNKEVYYYRGVSEEVEIIDGKLTLFPSIELGSVVVAISVASVIVVFKVRKVKEEKGKNKKLFDKYIRW